VETIEPQTHRPTAPDQPGILIEVAVAPRSGSPVLDILLAHGWLEAEAPVP
jgi:hypothetical protein